MTVSSVMESRLKPFSDASTSREQIDAFVWFGFAGVDDVLFRGTVGGTKLKGTIRNRENTDELRPQKKGGLSPPCVRNCADEPYFLISSFFVSAPFSILTSMM